MSMKASKKSFNLKDFIRDQKNKSLIIKTCCAVLAVSILCFGFIFVKNKFFDSNISWTLSESGTLTIEGKGEIKDFDPLKPDEWLKLGSDQKVKAIVIKEGITGIGDHAFYKCTDVTKVHLPKSLKSIGDFAFMGCKNLSSVFGADNSKLQSIGQGAFYGCANLKTLSLPEGIKTIGFDAFYGTSIYTTGVNWTDNALYIGNYLLDVKEDTEGEFTAKEGTVLVADYAFSQCAELEKISLPESAVYVGKYAFNACTKLKQVVFGGKLNAFNEGLFWNCAVLEKISGKYVFENQNSLTKKAAADWNHGTGDYEFTKE